jgi:predicted RNA-binding Zn-ribbon protein involved in translation (DUF1610 family)
VTTDGDERACRSCGYDLAGLDLHTTRYRCPECGVINIPNDREAGPRVPVRWPSSFLSACAGVWPGLALVVLGAIGSADPDWAQGFIVMAPILLIACIGWPVAWADMLTYTRLNPPWRGRATALLAAAGIIANGALAVASRR